MKILMVNKFFYVKGGSETYYFSLKTMLEKHGHTVVDFSMQDERNLHSEYAEYFVKNTDYNTHGGLFDKAAMAMKIVYSFEAREKFERLIQREKPDIVHLHLFQHQISPSILDVIRKYRLPCVYTAHDLKMICLNYKMMHHGRLCEDCRGGRVLPCLKNRCVKESLVKSAINAAEGIVHKFKKSYDAIDTVIVPSLFYRRKFAEFGVDEERLVYIPNFLLEDAPACPMPEDAGQYILYFGRLSEEKGIMMLLEALKATSVRLKIAGTGPLEKAISDYISRNALEQTELLGFQSGEKLDSLIAGARAVVLPSQWYENSPYSAIEALRLSRPLIAADIGGLPEMISGNGFVYSAQDAGALRECLIRMQNLDEEEYRTMEHASRSLFLERFTEKEHYIALMRVYEGAFKKAKQR